MLHRIHVPDDGGLIRALSIAGHRREPSISSLISRSMVVGRPSPSCVQELRAGPVKAAPARHRGGGSGGRGADEGGHGGEVRREEEEEREMRMGSGIWGWGTVRACLVEQRMKTMREKEEHTGGLLTRPRPKREKEKTERAVAK